MEKDSPHSKLSVVHALIQAGKVRSTRSALENARELGVFDLAAMCEVVLTL